MDEFKEMLDGSHMLFIAAGMGGGTGTGAAPVIAKLAREKGILTVGVVTKPFHFEGSQRMKLAEKGLEELQQYVDTLLVIPNQNLFRIANEKTTFADAFKMADDVLYAGVRGVTDLMVQPGLINLDFSDVKTVMSEMGKAMMGTGEASGEGRAVAAAEAAIANPLIDDVSLKGAKGLIINITGGNDITLYEVDEAANRIKQEVDEDANIIYGTTCDERLDGFVRVSIVATGIDVNSVISPKPLQNISNLSIDNSVYQNKSNNLNQDINTNAVDTNAVDTNVVDTNAVDTNVIDTNAVDTNVVDTNAVDLDGSFINKPKNLEVHEIDRDIEVLTNKASIGRSKEDIFSEDFNSTHQKNDMGNNGIEDLDIHPEFLEDTDHTNELNKIREESNYDPISERLLGENNIENQSISINLDRDSEEPSINVRKLSLFDTLEDNSSVILTSSAESDEKTEPVFQETINSEQINVNSEDVAEEFSSEESSIEENFTQENEEELLDIPTFLRRQAN